MQPVRFWRFSALCGLLALGFWMVTPSHAGPTAPQALQLSPVQKSVKFDRPDASDAAKCTIRSVKSGGTSGWIVRDESGQLLRRFLDSNSDNKVDMWCYYNNGVECYRDVDSDFNGRADQYRWLGTSGTRWGVDKDEDGTIDLWKVISPEEVSFEVVEAIRASDDGRFRRLLLDQEELGSIGLGEDQKKIVSKALDAASTAFTKLTSRQSLIRKDSEWVNFSGGRPGVIPAGTADSTKDMTVYENAVALVSSGSKHDQVLIGTMIRVGDVWRIIDVPTNLVEGLAQIPESGFFFNSPLAPQAAAGDTNLASSNERVQKLLDELEKVDRALMKAAGTDKEKFNARRAGVLEQIVDASPNQEQRIEWTRQLADMLSASIQAGEFPTGITRLKSLYDKTAASSRNEGLVAYIKFRYLTADFNVQIQAPGADFANIQETWLKDLETFVADYPSSDDASEAMLQLAIAKEFSGEEDDAKKWYRRITADFPGTIRAKKALGATRRLDSVGTAIELRGAARTGTPWTLRSSRGKHVLIHYWATWCEPCKRDLETIKEMYAKYGSKGFQPVGISLDNDRQTLNNYLGQNRLSWTQLFEEGGLDSRLANELGIVTLPTMLLVDDKGKVVNRNIHISELESELRERLRK